MSLDSLPVNLIFLCTSLFSVTIYFTHCVRFGDSKGVNYLKFLEQLQPSEELEDKYQTRMTQLSTRQAMVRKVGGLV